LSIGGVAVAVVAAFVVAVVASGGDSDDGSGGDVPAQTAEVELGGSALAPFPGNDATDPAVGRPSPTASGTDFDGTAVSVAGDATPKVLLFVAHWCPHCQKEVPLLAPAIQSGAVPETVQMVTISTNVNDAAPNYPPSEWLEREGWPTPVIRDDPQSSAAAHFGLQSFPYFVFVDGDGNVVSRYSGEMPVEEFEQRVADLAPAR
jgi:thiol-disulfide isomerase/thioredoxin